MPASMLQEKSGTTAGAGTTEAVAFTANVTANNTIEVEVTWVNTGGVTCTVADNLNGSYGPALRTLAGATQTTALWIFPGSSAGAVTVTATFSATTTNKAISIAEIDSGRILMVTAAQSQTAPGTGTGAVSSGTSGTLAMQPALVRGFTNALATTTPAAADTGAGFAAGTGGWSISGVTQATTESKRVTATTAVAGTFTAATGTAVYHTFVVVYAEWTGPAPRNSTLAELNRISTTLVEPPGTKSTDGLVFIATVDSGAPASPWTTPDGTWVQSRVIHYGSDGQDFVLFSRQPGGTGGADAGSGSGGSSNVGAGGTYTFTSSSDFSGGPAALTAIFGAATSSWISDLQSTTSTGASTITAPSVTAVANSLIIAAFNHDSGGSGLFSTPTGNVAIANSTDGDSSIGISCRVQLSSGASGGTSSGPGSSPDMAAIQIAIAPPSSFTASAMVAPQETTARRPDPRRSFETQIPSPRFVARGSGMIDQAAPRAAPSRVARPYDQVLLPAASAAPSGGLIDQAVVRRAPFVVSPAIDGQIPSQDFAAVGSGAVDSQTMSRPPALAARALTDQVPSSLFQPIFQADGTIPKVILKLVTDSQIPSQDFVTVGSGFFDTTPLPRPPALVARAVDGPIPSRNFAAVGSGILEQNPPARPFRRVVLATEGQVLPPLFLPIVQADGTVAYAVRRLSTEGPIPSQLFAARGSGLFDPAPISRPLSLVSRAATDQALVPMFGPSIVGDVAWRPRPLVILSVDGALPEIFGMAAGAGPIDAGVALRPAELRRRQAHAETALSLLLGPAVQADATAPRGWRARFLEQAALGAPVPTSIFGLVDMGAPALVPWMRPRVSENLISPQIPFVASKIADSPLLARFRPFVVLSTDGPIPMPFMVAVGSGMIDAWAPALRRTAPRSPVDLQALAALFGPAIDAPLPASWRWRVRPVVDAVVPGPFFGPVVDSDPGQRRGNGARQAWSDGIGAIRLAGPIADAEPGTRRWTAAHVILDGGVVPPRPPSTLPIVQTDSFGARRWRMNLSTDNAVPTGFVVTVFGLVDAGRPQPVDRARQRGTDLAILPLLPPRPPFSRIARPAIVEFCVASTVGDIVLFQDYQKLMSVEFAGRVSASNRHDDPIAVEVFRTIGAVVAQSLGGLQMYLHVTTADGMQVVPLSGCVILDGTGIVGLAVSGWGEVEILLLGNM